MAGCSVTSFCNEQESILCAVMCCVQLGDTIISVSNVFVGKE